MHSLIAEDHDVHLSCTCKRKRQLCRCASRSVYGSRLLAVESKLAGKQREVADLQELNTRLFARFQAMREQLARSQDKLSHDKLKGACAALIPAQI